VLALALLWLAVRSRDGGDGRAASRLPGMALAAAWAWTGAAFHGQYFAAINFMAPIYGALFLVQAVLLAWSGVLHGRITSRPHDGPVGWAGLALIAYALLGYPLLAAVAGDGLATARVVGLDPGPTVVFTLGMLLLADGRTSLHLAAVPVLWTLIAGATAWALGVAEDLVLPLFGLGSLALILSKNRRRRTA
jgi:Family of unknown function (DUF6064)